MIIGHKKWHSKFPLLTWSVQLSLDVAEGPTPPLGSCPAEHVAAVVHRSQDQAQHGDVAESSAHSFLGVWARKRDVSLFSVLFYFSENMCFFSSLLTSSWVAACIHLSTDNPNHPQSTGNTLQTPDKQVNERLQFQVSCSIYQSQYIGLTGQFKPPIARQKRKAGYISSLRASRNYTSSRLIASTDAESIQAAAVLQFMLHVCHFCPHVRILVCTLNAVEDIPSLRVVAVHLGVLRDKSMFLHNELESAQANARARTYMNKGVAVTHNWRRSGRGAAPILTGTLYFLRALPTCQARCPTMKMLATPVRTT